MSFGPPKEKTFSLDELEALVDDDKTSDIVLVLAFQWSRRILELGNKTNVTIHATKEKHNQLLEIHSKLLKRVRL